VALVVLEVLRAVCGFAQYGDHMRDPALVKWKCSIALSGNLRSVLLASVAVPCSKCGSLSLPDAPRPSGEQQVVKCRSCQALPVSVPALCSQRRVRPRVFEQHLLHLQQHRHSEAGMRVISS